MLDHIPRSIPPIIEYLAAQNMPPHAPHIRIPLANQPLMAQILRIEVVDFEGAVVHVRFFGGRHEEGVVVCVGGADVDVAQPVGGDALAHP